MEYVVLQGPFNWQSIRTTESCDCTKQPASVKTSITSAGNQYSYVLLQIAGKGLLEAMMLLILTENWFL